MNQVQQKLFDQLVNGDGDALVELIELERPILFDLAMRMTGQFDYSLRAVDETTKVLLGLEEEFQDLADLRMRMYVCLRGMGSDSWNAEVGKLENLGFQRLFSESSPVQLKELQGLDRAMNRLTGWEREVILLRLRLGFSVPEVGKIINVPEADAESYLQGALLRLRSLGANLPVAQLQKLLQALPAHPLNDRATMSTMALSAMMDDLQKSRSAPVTFRWWWVILAFIIAAAAVYSSFKL